MRRLLLVEPHKLCACGRSSEHTKCGRRMPTFLVVVEVHSAPQARLYLEAHDVSSEDVPPGCVQFLRQPDKCRQNRRRRVSSQVVRAVVEIENVGSNTVDERR